MIVYRVKNLFLIAWPPEIKILTQSEEMYVTVSNRLSETFWWSPLALKTATPGEREVVAARVSVS